jgi:hypothetical protein
VKGIGIFVAILLAAIAVAMYFATRAPNRALDAEGRAWVDGYQVWNSRKQRELDRARVGMGFASEAKNARLIEPLRECFATFVRFGEPPGFLSDVGRLTLNACGRAEHAVDVNERFGRASLATTKFHLNHAETLLLTARRALRIELEKASD